jgi:predicted NUDIX family phosphoesterase
MKICCIERRIVPLSWLHGTGLIADDFFSTVSDDSLLWIERSHAEEDESYKQIIPYVLVQNSAGDLLSYRRHGTEARLHGLYSCGIGGHIEECDRHESFASTVRAGLLRELAEELINFTEDSVDLMYKGLISDAASAVSRVHLGLVFTARCHAGFIPQPGEELTGMEWKTPEAVRVLRTEQWTTLALSCLV